MGAKGGAESGLRARTSWLRGRVVGVAVLGIVFNAWLIAKLEVGRWIMLGTVFSLSPLALTETLLLFLLTRSQYLRPDWRWQSGDYLALYILLTLGTVPAGFDNTHALTGLLAFPFSPFVEHPGGMSAWLQHLPRWAMVSNERAANAFVLGKHDFWSEGLWRAWCQPLLGWVGLLITVSAIYLGCSYLLERPWAHHQRLAFPLALVPLTLFAEERTIWRNRTFWTGVLLAAALSTLVRWHDAFPVIPALPTEVRQIPNPFTERPWSALGDLFVGCPLWAFGMAYLVPLDVLFSTWICYWGWRLVPVIAAVWGQDDSQRMFVFQASYGAYLGLGLSALWLIRRHLWNVLRQVVGYSMPQEAREVRRYRLAVLLMGGGALGLWGFSRWLGLSTLFTIAFFGLLLLAAVALSRIRAELGAAVYGMSGMGPAQMLAQTLGLRAFAPTDLAVGAAVFSYGITYVQRNNLMPLQVEAFKIAEHGGGARPALMLSMLGATGLGTLLSMVFVASVFTRQGALSGKISSGYHTVYTWGADTLDSWQRNPPGFHGASTLAVGAGVLAVLLLQVLRMRIPGFPLHPLGLAIAADYNCHFYWMPLLLAWLVKGLLLRYGGARVSQALIPFCLGLIVGEFVATVFNALLIAAIGLRVAEFTL